MAVLRRPNPPLAPTDARIATSPARGAGLVVGHESASRSVQAKRVTNDETHDQMTDEKVAA